MLTLLCNRQCLQKSQYVLDTVVVCDLASVKRAHIRPSQRERIIAMLQRAGGERGAGACPTIEEKVCAPSVFVLPFHAHTHTLNTAARKCPTSGTRAIFCDRALELTRKPPTPVPDALSLSRQTDERLRA